MAKRQHNLQPLDLHHTSFSKKHKPDLIKQLENLKTAGSGLKLAQHGNVFQLRLLTLILWRIRTLKFADFGLATELSDGEKFDDIVLQYYDNHKWRVVFLQAKHKETEPGRDIEKIKKADLLATDDKAPFGMSKYFEAFVRIKRVCQGELKQSILEGSEIDGISLITNADLDQKELKDCFKPDLNRSLEGDQLLRTGLAEAEKLFVNEAASNLLRREFGLVFKCTSEFNELVETLANCCCKDQQADGTIRILSDYSNVLLDRVVEKVEQANKKAYLKFRGDFINQPGTQTDEKILRDTLAREIFFRQNPPALTLSNTFGNDQLNNVSAADIDNIAENLAAAAKSGTDLLIQNFGPHYGLLRSNVFNCSERRFLPRFIKGASNLKTILKKKLGNKTNEQLQEMRFKGDRFFACGLENGLPTDEDQLTDLARLLADVIRSGKSADLVHCEQFQIYHIALAKEVIHVKSQKFHDFFIVGDSRRLSSAGRVFRRILIDDLIDVDHATTFLTNAKIRFSEGFVKTDKILWHDLPQPIDNRLVQEFFDKFSFIIRYPNRTRIKQILTDEIKATFNTLDCDAFLSLFETDFYEWMSKRIGDYYTPRKTTGLMNRINETLRCFRIDGFNESYFATIRTTLKFQNENLVNLIDGFLRGTGSILQLSFGVLKLGRSRLVQTFRVMQEKNQTEIRQYIQRFGFIFIRLSQLGDSSCFKLLSEACCHEKNWSLIVIECDAIGSRKSIDKEIVKIVTELTSLRKRKIILITEEYTPLDTIEVTQLEKVETKFNDLSEESKILLLQNGVVSLHSRKFPISEVVDLSTLSQIDSSTLYQLIKGCSVEVGSANPTNDSIVYIDRVLQTPVFRPVNLQSLDAATFCVQHDIDVTEGQIDVFVFGNTQTAAKIDAEYQKTNITAVHWIAADMTWIKSRGSILKLLQFRTEEYERILALDNCQNELAFLNRCAPQKLVLINGIAGSGKSNLLSHVSKLIVETNPLVWPIWIDLNAYSDFLNDNLLSNLTSNFADFLFDLLQSSVKSRLQTHFEVLLFRNTFQNSQRKLKFALFFDSFDEVRAKCGQIVIDLFLCLERSPAVHQIFITTRPNFRIDLEKCLNTVAYNLSQLSQEDQINLLANRWRYLSKDNDTDENVTYQNAKRLLVAFSKMIDDKDWNFTGIPRHLRILSENIDSKTAVTECQLFPMFHDLTWRLYQTYNRDKMFSNGNTAASMRLLDKKFEKLVERHQLLALSVILTDEEMADIISEGHYHALKAEINAILQEFTTESEQFGIIVEVINGRAIFVHQSFAEYFLSYRLGNLILNNVEQNLTKWSFRLLALKVLDDKKFQVTRRFLNSLISERSMDFSESALKHLSQEIDFAWYSQTLTRFCFVRILSEEFDNLKLLLLRCFDLNANLLLDIIADFLANNPTWQNLPRVCSKISVTTVNELRLLHDAAYFGALSVCKEWIKIGAAIDLHDENDWNCLHFAASGGHLHVCQWLMELIQNGGCELDVKAKTSDGLNLLHVAVKSGSQELCTWLVHNGFDIFDKSFDECTPLHLASSCGHFEICHVLINSLCETRIEELVNARNCDGCTSLHCAAKTTGKSNLIEFLISKGADVTLRDKNHWTALQYCIFFGDIEYVQLITAGGFVNPGEAFYSVDASKRTPFHYAARCGDYKKCHYLLSLATELRECGVIHQVDSSGATVLHEAVKSGNAEICSVFLEQNIDSTRQDGDGSIGLHYAAASGNIEICRILLDDIEKKDAKDCLNIKNNSGQTVLHSAAFGGSRAVFELLVPHYNLASDASQAVAISCLAASSGNLELCQWLSAKPFFDFQQTDIHGSTIFHYAVSSGQIELIDWLLKVVHSNPDVIDTENKYGYSILQASTQTGDAAMLRYLVDKGGDVDCIDENRLTLLHYAALNGNSDACKYLVSLESYKIIKNKSKTKGRKRFKSILTARSKDGVNVLHAAAKSGNLKLCKWLVRSGVEVNAVDAERRNALFYAVSAHRTSDDSLAGVIRKNDISVGYKASDLEKMSLVRWLLRKGLSTEQKNKSGESVFE